MGIILTRRKRVGRWLRPRRWLPKHWVTFGVTVNGHQVLLFGRRFWGVSAFRITRPDGDVLIWPDASSYQEVSKVKKRKQGAEPTAASHLAAVESAVFGKMHALVAHCAATRYDDGDPRKPGWITIKTAGSAWIVEAKDPDTSSKLTAIQPTLDDALALLSLLLEAEEAPWEHDQWLAAAAAKAKKK